MARFRRGGRLWIYATFFALVAPGCAWLVGETIPKASTYLWGSEFRRELSVASKSESNRRYRCNRLVIKEYQSLPLNHVCVPQSLWDRVAPGQTVVASGIENNFGLRVTRVVASRD